jgi:hypothetical protein
MITKRHCNVDNEDDEVVLKEEKEVKSEKRRESERLKIKRLSSDEEIEFLYNETRATFIIIRLA